MTQKHEWLTQIIIQENWSHIRYIEGERRWMLMTCGTIG